MIESIFELDLSPGHVIQIRQGDITDEDTDAIVNAANSHLAHGGGVAAAIARKAGPVLEAESRNWIDEHGPVPVGQVAITSGGHLACRKVIHAVGPVWQDGDQRQVFFPPGDNYFSRFCSY